MILDYQIAEQTVDGALRQKALEMALQPWMGGTDKEVLARAASFYGFLKVGRKKRAKAISEGQWRPVPMPRRKRSAKKGKRRG